MYKRIDKHLTKFIAIIMVLTICLTQVGIHNYSYAATENKKEDSNTVNVSGESFIVKKSGICFESDGFKFVAPIKYNKGIELNGGKCNMTLKLPDIGDVSDGTVHDNKVVYSSIKGNAQYCISMENKNEDGVTAIDTNLVVADESYGDRFAYSYKLPEGYKLMASDDYYRQFDDAKSEADKYAGETYVVNENNEISYIIYPASASDAAGNDITVDTLVNGNDIIQEINADDSTAYPITISSKAANGWKTYTKYKTLAQVKAMRDRYAPLSPASIAEDVMTVLVGSLGGYVGLGGGLICIAADASIKMNYAAWKKVYSRFKSSGKKYAKISQAVRIRRPYTAPKPVKVVFVNTK